MTDKLRVESQCQYLERSDRNASVCNDNIAVLVGNEEEVLEEIDNTLASRYKYENQQE